MVRSDLAARGQEACLYTEGDSLQLRTKPYLWYEESQVSGDSMNVYLKHRKLERLLVMGNTLTMSESDSLHPGRYDQMMGDLLTMQFDTSGLHRTDVEGRAISVYHLYDDSLANGLNRTSGDRIVILFAGTQGYLDEFEVKDIRAFEVGLYKYFDAAQTALIEDLTKEKKLDNLRDKLHAALKEYSANFKAEQAAK